MQRNAQFGFTLYEALIVVGITAVLIGAGVPAFGSLLDRTRLRGEHDEFLSAINYARGLAVETATPVVLCPSTDAVNCAEEPDWHRGWLVFEDLDRDREHDLDETIYRSHPGLEPGVTITSSRYRRRIGYLPDGRAYGSNLTLRVCSEQGVPPRAIIISNSGRPRSADLPPTSCD